MALPPRRRTGADEGPVAEGGPQALPAREHERAQRAQGGFEVGVDGTPAPELVVEQRDDAPFHPGADLGEARRRARQAAGGRRRSHPVIVGVGSAKPISERPRART
jgi:hypothetical protein